MRLTARGARLLVIASLVGGSIGACSLLTDVSGLTGDGDGASIDGSSGKDAARDNDGGASDGAPPPLTACNDAGSVCAPGAPLGWFGPVYAYEGPPATAPACPRGGAPSYEGHADLDAPPASCTPCTCGSPSATGNCDSVDVITFNNPGCPGTGECAQVTLRPGVCTPILVGCGNTSTRVTSPRRVDAGSCAPGGGQMRDASTPAWKRSALACPVRETPSDRCARDERCVPPGQSPFATQLCIVQLGDVNCPTGPYFNRHVYHQSFADQRACGCSCGPPEGSCGAGSLFVSSCADAAPGFFAPSSCIAKVALGSAILTGEGQVLDGGACAPDGGPIGAATPTQPTTFCCSR